jgi:hypothetical protein
LRISGAGLIYLDLWADLQVTATIEKSSTAIKIGKIVVRIV